MNQEVAENNLRKLRVLVAPLDWGLGHATRCIPIIHELINLGCEPILAAEGAQEALLRIEFPDLLIIPLEGYRVKYGKSGWRTVLKIILQAGRITRMIKKENAWLKKTVQEYSIDAIISDNRYGLFHETIPTVIITHQLQIRSPFGKFSEKALRRRNFRYLNRFRECWVPDFRKGWNLGGDLSHPGKHPKVPVRYVGPLSRFQGMSANHQISAKQKLLVIISGPEPQRSILENKIVNDIAGYDGEATVLRGLPTSERIIPSTNRIKFYNHLSSAELYREMSEASLIIARSGYSTVMDIFFTRKKTVLVPTPGQSEQEYLSKHLATQGFAPSIDQKDFILEKALSLARSYQYNLDQQGYDPALLREAVEGFVTRITKDKVFVDG